MYIYVCTQKIIQFYDDVIKTCKNVKKTSTMVKLIAKLQFKNYNIKQTHNKMFKNILVKFFIFAIKINDKNQIIFSIFLSSL